MALCERLNQKNKTWSMPEVVSMQEIANRGDVEAYLRDKQRKTYQPSLLIIYTIGRPMASSSFSSKCCAMPIAIN